jgi:hypothetical protein
MQPEYEISQRMNKPNMVVHKKLSTQTRHNWWIDAVLFSSAVLATLSGIYFLFLPVGGYQGGRNPWYGVTILFTRHTWDLLHTWSGVIMIAVVTVHLSLHWPWVLNITRRTINGLRGKAANINARSRFNLATNIVIATSFLLATISSFYFLIYPSSGGLHGPRLIFNSTTWDLIHSWSGTLFIIAAVLHFAIHWKWITKVTRKILTIDKPKTALKRPEIASANIASTKK